MRIEALNELLQDQLGELEVELQVVCAFMPFDIKRALWEDFDPDDCFFEPEIMYRDEGERHSLFLEER